MIINTRDFGYIEVMTKDIITFNDGIPGFEQHDQYVLLVHNEVENSAIWMQSVESPEICFIVFSPSEILPSYKPSIPQEAIKELKIKSQDSFRVLVIATIPDDITQMTLNLKSPIIINAKKGIAKQVVLQNEDYPIRYYYFDSADQGVKQYADCK